VKKVQNLRRINRISQRHCACGKGWPWACRALLFYALRANYPWKGLMAVSGVAIFYPFGYPTPYAYGLRQRTEHWIRFAAPRKNVRPCHFVFSFSYRDMSTFFCWSFSFCPFFRREHSASIRDYVRPLVGPLVSPLVPILLPPRRARAWLEFCSCFCPHFVFSFSYRDLMFLGASIAPL
jgi:hypothetical protein